MADRHHVALRLWNGKTVETAAMRWSSKRLIADLALNPSDGVREESAISVTRRIGSAAQRRELAGPRRLNRRAF